MLASGMCLLQREWRSRVSATQAASAARSECPERATSSAVKGKSHLRYERRVLRLFHGAEHKRGWVGAATGRKGVT